MPSLSGIAAGFAALVLALSVPLGAASRAGGPGAPVPGVVDVTAFGAMPDGSGDAGPAFTAAARALDISAGGRFVVPPGVYNFETSFDIPKFEGSAVVAFEMMGATLRTTRPIGIFRRMPRDQSEAMRMIGAMLRFRGGRFLGSASAGQIGLELGATYGSSIEGTQFDALDIGFDGYFNLGLRVEGVRATKNRSVDLRVQSGRDKWPGATLFNSGSNHTTFEGVRIYGHEGAFANIAVFGASGVSIRNSIVEGENPQNAIHFDDQGAIVQVFVVDNLHSESAPKNAVIRLTGRKAGVVHTISNVFLQTATTLLDARDIGVATINVRDIPYVAPLKQAFRISDGAGGVHGTLWNFQNWPGHIADPKWWQDGRVPLNLVDVGRDASGRGVRIEAPNLVVGSSVPGGGRVELQGRTYADEICLRDGVGDRSPVCVRKADLARLLATQVHGK